MNKTVSFGLNVGIAVLGLGILLAVGGILGRNWADKANITYRADTRDEREVIQKQLISDGMPGLMARIEDMGPIWVTAATETHTGLQLKLQPPIAPVIESFISDLEGQLSAEFPEIPHVVQFSLNVLGAAPGSRLISWSRGNPGLSAEEIENPGAFNIGSNYNGAEYRRLTDLWLSIPSTEELRFLLQRDDTPSVANVISQHFPDNFRRNYSGDGYILESYLHLQVFDQLASSNQLLLVSKTVLDRLSKLGFLLLFIGPALGVVLDARKRRLPALLWGLFVLPTSALGMLIYALVNREVGPVCPECGERVSARYVVCPYCQTELKGTCATCGQVVGLNWHYCPSCSTEI